MKYLTKLIKKLDELEVIREGCSEEEISAVEKMAGDKLPKCYKEFLAEMGKDMDRKEDGKRGFLVGNTVFYDDLININGEDGFLGFLKEDESDLEIPNKAFVFYCSQGILYAFFKLDEGDDPPVYAYAKGFKGSEFPKISDSLSGFYEMYLEGYNHLFKAVY